MKNVAQQLMKELNLETILEITHIGINELYNSGDGLMLYTSEVGRMLKIKTKFDIMFENSDLGI